VKIAVDARQLLGQVTGVGRFVHEILVAWAGLPEAASHEIVLCAPARVDTTPYAGLRVSTIAGPRQGTLWEQLTLPVILRTAGADVLFSPAYTAPLRSPVPTLLAIHDVSFAAHPEWFSLRDGARLRTISRLAATRARRVMTVSQFSKREITAHLGVDPDKIAVIYHGLTRLAPNPEPPPPIHHPRSTILFVGSVFNRRHIPELVEGFAALAASHPTVELEVVGSNRTSPWVDLAALVRESSAAQLIHIRDYVSDAELATLYGRARAFVFLSDYEGFGLTPLEALGTGIPIVVLDTPVAHEVYGPAATYVARPEPDLIRAALEQVLFDDAERARVLGAAPEVLARYSWSDCSAQVLAEILRAGRS
jgi:glycosyltransferase involved in cell wall biosynthesis